jgi:hypothetical protein
MRRAALLAAAAALALPAPAGAARVDVMVVGKQRVLHAPAHVRLKQRTVKVAGRRCRLGARTPLSVLAGTGLRLRLRDYGHCGRRPRDASDLYVAKVAGERERGNGGWVYKVGRRVGTAGAGAPAGVRLRAGRRVLWFWCELGAGGCQRTLEVRPERTTAEPGGPLHATVRGYDDFGRGVAVAGAAVRLGPAAAVTGADGTAVLTVPARTGRLRLRAERNGMVRAFPVEVRVG